MTLLLFEYYAKKNLAFFGHLYATNKPNTQDLLVLTCSRSLSFSKRYCLFSSTRSSLYKANKEYISGMYDPRNDRN